MSTALERQLAALKREGWSFAHVLRSTPNPQQPSYDVLTVGCPFCSVEHTHGSTARARGVLGHRVPHCITAEARELGRRGYYLVDLRDAPGH